jgi:hypothetical protein
MAIAGERQFLFASELNATGHLKALKCVWRKTLHRAKVSYFRIYDLRSAYATRLSAGGVADEWVTQLLRQGDSQVFKKYSQMKLRMKREALQKLERQPNEMKTPFGRVSGTVAQSLRINCLFGTLLAHSGTVWTVSSGARIRNWFRMKRNIGMGV